MNFTLIAIDLLIGIAVGAATITLLFYLVRQQIINEATEEADELLKETRDQFEADELERKERTQEIELEAWAEVEEAHLLMEQKCESLESEATHKKNLNEEKYKNLRASLMLKENELRDLSLKANDKQSTLNKLVTLKKELEENFKKGLTIKTQMEELQVLTEIKTKLTDAGLLDLQEFSSLQSVDLYGTSVTDAGVRKLRKALPNLQIAHESL